MFRKKLKMTMEMIDVDTLVVGLTNPYGHFTCDVDVGDMSFAEKFDAITLELASDGWIVDQRMMMLITRELYLLAYNKEE